MLKTPYRALISLGLLSACGAPPDDQSNIPLSGQWSEEGKLIAIKIGGTAVDMAEVPGAFRLARNINKTKEFCGEPRFLTKEEFQERINDNPAKCEIKSVSANGDRVSASGICKGLKLSGNYSGSASFTGETRLQSDKVVYNMTINAVVTDPSTGEGEMVSMEARQTLSRLGDC